MAVPRPLLLTLLGTVLLAATFLAMSNANTTSQKAAKPAAQPQTKAPLAKPAQTKGTAALSAPDAVRALASPGKPVNSARFELRMSERQLHGKRRSSVSRVSGSFAPGASGAPVSFDVRGVDDGAALHVVSAAGKGYFLKGSKSYALPDSPKRAVASRQALAGQEAAKLPSVDPAPWFKRLRAAAGPELDGVATTHVTGVLDSKKMAKDMRGLVGTAQKQAQQQAALPRGFGKKLESAFKGTRLDAYVGTQDKVVRRLRLTTNAVSPSSLLSGGQRLHVALDLRLAEVNKPQKISAPSKVASKGLSKRQRRIADGSFIASAVALDPPAGLAQMSAGYFRTISVARSRRIPRKVEAAVSRHKRLVLFFYQRKGVDDRVTASAVRSLRKRTKALVFSDSIDNLAAYGQVVQSVGVTRAPSVVIISRKGKARLVDGYIDPSALAQEVADTR